ncbi:MAG: hypothetical protein AVDCRST_MAG40-2843, partial [uncultured Gemmatimonadaceae bacterium]
MRNDPDTPTPAVSPRAHAPDATPGAHAATDPTP